MGKDKKSLADKRRRSADREESGGSQFSYLNLPEGITEFKPDTDNDSKVTMDIIPYVVSMKNHFDKDEAEDIAVKGTLWYRLVFRIHKNIGAEGAKRDIVCPSTFGKPCPICKEFAHLKEEGADWEEIKDLAYKSRHLFYVMIDGYKKKSKPQVFNISEHLFYKILKEQCVDENEFYTFDSLTDGCLINVKFAAQTFQKAKYVKATKFTFAERKHQYPEDFSKDLPALEDLLIVLSEKEIDKLYHAVEDVDAEDVTEKSKKKNKKDKSEKKDKDENVNRKQKKGKEKEEEEDKPEKKDKKKDKGKDKKDKKDKKEKEESEPERKKKKDDSKDGKKKKDGKKSEEDTSSGNTKDKKKDKDKGKDDKGGKNKCPHGHRFGVDTDDFKDCDKCKLWNKCIAKKEG